MTQQTSMRPLRASHGVFRGVLLGVLLVAAVITGLLAMHTLNLHGTAAADAPGAISMSAGSAESGHHAAPASSASHGSSGTPDISCAGCSSDDHTGMATMCVLALLLLLLLLLPPRLRRGWVATLLPHPALEGGFARVIPRAPSLHVLCISRT